MNRIPMKNKRRKKKEEYEEHKDYEDVKKKHNKEYAVKKRINVEER